MGDEGVSMPGISSNLTRLVQHAPVCLHDSMHRSFSDCATPAYFVVSTVVLISLVHTLLSRMSNGSASSTAACLLVRDKPWYSRQCQTPAGGGRGKQKHIRGAKMHRLFGYQWKSGDASPVKKNVLFLDADALSLAQSPPRLSA